MTSVKVYFIDGSEQTFNSTNGFTLLYEQFWLQLNDNENRPIAAIPREQVKYVATPLNAI